MKVILSGFFDRNFGDDQMMRIIAHYLPEFEFLIREDNEYTALLLKEKNISLCSGDEGPLPVLIVTGSGFMINSRDSLKCELVWFLKRKRIGDYCLGCNIEPLGSRLREFLIKRKLSRFKLIICRDSASYDWLKAACPRTSVYRLPDILFSIPEEWLPEREDSGMLGISLMRREDDDAQCGYYSAMAEAADHWVETKGGGVYLMAFDTGTEDDAFACREVRRMMKYPHKADVVSYSGNNEIIRAYARCTKIIGARFHSAVLAMRMGIEFFPVIFREKMRRLIDETNHPVKGCDINNIDLAGIKRFLDSPSREVFPDKELFNRAKEYADIFRKEYQKRR